MKPRGYTGKYHSHWMNVSLQISLHYTHTEISDAENTLHRSCAPLLDIHFLPGGTSYKPILYMNDFWNMQRDYQPLNDTIEHVELRLTYQPLSLFKWQIYAAQSVRNKWTASFMGLLRFKNSQVQSVVSLHRKFCAVGFIICYHSHRRDI